MLELAFNFIKKKTKGELIFLCLSPAIASPNSTGLSFPVPKQAKHMLIKVNTLRMLVLMNEMF